MADSSPAFAKVTANDHSAGVTVTNIVLILFSGITVIAKSLIRFRTATVASLDNLAIFSALVLAIAQSICVQLAVNHGLGTHQNAISPSEFNSYSKANYAAQILLVLVLACTKLAVTQLILAIQPQKRVLLACRVLTGLIGVWTITSVFALAFQCDVPHPYIIHPDRCVNLPALYDYIGVLNILTDIALVVIPVPMMWKIQIAKDKKVLVIGLFAMRLLVPPIVIVQLVYLTRYHSHLSDQTWANTTPWIVTQVVMNVSIITACIPSLRRVVTELRTRQTGVQVSEGMEFGTRKSEKYGTGNSKSSATRKQRSREQTTAASAEDDEEQAIPYGHNPPHDKTRRGLAHITSGRRSPAWQNESQTRPSQERLKDDIGITRTVDYTVEEDELAAKSSDGDRSIEYKAM